MRLVVVNLEGNTTARDHTQAVTSINVTRPGKMNAVAPDLSSTFNSLFEFDLPTS